MRKEIQGDLRMDDAKKHGNIKSSKFTYQKME